MNGATAIVFLIVIAIMALAAYGAYRSLKTGGCSGCPNRGTDCCCHGKNPINCTIKRR